MNIVVPLADGFEEIEALATVDVLRRAGFNVVTAGIPGTMITGARHIKVFADKRLDDINFDEVNALVLPGGNPGYVNLGKSSKIIETIKKFDSEKKLIAAICMAPTVLVKAGILEDRVATVYPGGERQLPRPRDGRVVVDEHIITSQGPGTAIEFALKIVETLSSQEKADELRHQLVY
jgi:4-methyl-5(b-hydroxyethyl)-thiazole monophosphate biosynthesis